MRAPWNVLEDEDRDMIALHRLNKNRPSCSPPKGRFSCFRHVLEFALTPGRAGAAGGGGRRREKLQEPSEEDGKMVQSVTSIRGVVEAYREFKVK